ncbi:YfcC family protein [Hufsiella ginkgonis]|uniref:YfcC family protein n=1 Tax=Hufsiella ginkgonis TaxID=2695274 RepID=A0A7K1XWA3_9SPHI|nr:YfcC family protein [Hufsiella ginkgonis]MXV15274.1 YfcC family protein [Hufsiella ginkgonis]
MFKKIPQPLTILVLIIVVAAALTWILPAGRYSTLTYRDKSFTVTSPSGEKALPFTQQTLDSLHILVKLTSFGNGDIRKPVSIPGTYQKLPGNRQGIVNIVEAPLKGIYDTIDIILFVLVIGGFIGVFYSSGAMEKGLAYLSYKMAGREGWLIIILTFLFSFGGTSYGMAEEGIAFYPILVPLFLAAGYDLIVPVAVIFGGTQLGTLSSFSNPFSTITASNAAGINWADGIYGRLLLFVVSTGIFTGYVLKYAGKVKKDPTASFVYRFDGVVKPHFPAYISGTAVPKPDGRTNLLLALFLVTFLVMIGGVVFLDWWLLEMSAVFVISAIIVAMITRLSEKQFLEKFIKGAQELLGVVFIIGVARGITIILNEGTISDSIIYGSVQLVDSMPSSLFIIMLLVLFMVFTLFISSSSGMAVVTMPIIGSLAIMIGVPGREIVNSYLYGMGIMGLITPAGLILPSLALANVNLKAWLRFIWPFMVIIFLVCVVFLLVGIRL